MPGSGRDAGRSSAGSSDDDVSLTYDAATTRGDPARRRRGRGRRRRHLRGAGGGDGGRRPDRPVVRLLRLRLPDRPARATPPRRPTVPDAVWMRARRVRMFDHADRDAHEWSRHACCAGCSTSERRCEHSTARDAGAGVPEDYAAAFERVQEHLHAGNSYEVNLTYRTRRAATLDPAAAYLRLRPLNPAPYAGFLQHDLPGHEAWLLSSSPERYALVTDRPDAGDEADQGDHPAGRDGRTRTRCCAAGWRASRSSARRT